MDKQLTIFLEHKPLVYLNAYQKLAVQTDKNRNKGLNGLRLPLLGLFGEVGSLVSELKKKAARFRLLHRIQIFGD